MGKTVIEALKVYNIHVNNCGTYKTVQLTMHIISMLVSQAEPVH